MIYENYTYVEQVISETVARYHVFIMCIYFIHRRLCTQ